MRLFIMCLCLLCLLPGRGDCQDGARNKGNAFAFNISYAYQLPAADLSRRFGANSNVGIGAEYITDGSDFIFGFQSGFLFGNVVKTDVLSGLRTEEGFIIGNDRVVADVQLRERGFYIGGMAGKLLPLSIKEPRSGLRFTIGAGLLQHKIRIQDDAERPVAALSDEYKKGYDRLSNGLAFNSFLGYQMLSLDGRINFFIGVEAIYGATRNRRSFNFDTRSTDTRQYNDVLLGLRVGWVLPFYVGKGAREIYY
jgi:hypothetical protein